ncbi:unnamed protein product, partial [Pylaiella littoralis]
MSAEVLSITGYAWELSLECQSNEPWELGSHPSDVAEWTCNVVSVEDFGVSCGCASAGSASAPTPVGSTAPPATPVASTDAPVGTVVGASGCSGSDSFAILSLALEEFDGCYLDAESIYEEGTFFSQTGEFADGALSMFAATIDNGQT